MSPDELGFLHDPGRLINDGILLDVGIGRRPTPREPKPPLVAQRMRMFYDGPSGSVTMEHIPQT